MITLHLLVDSATVAHARFFCRFFRYNLFILIFALTFALL